MSADIKHKLSEYEVTPPVSAWERISEELGEINSFISLHSKLYDHSVPAPGTSWQKIEAALGNEMPVTAVAATLWTAEVDPPADTWEKINTALGEPLLVKRRVFPWLKYAAAAVVLVFAGFAIVRLLGNNKVKDPVAVNHILPITQPDRISPAPNDQKTSTEIKAEEENRNDVALEESKKTYAKLDLSKKKRLDLASDFRFSSYDENAAPTDNYDGKSNLSDRYIVLMTPEGNFIRVSKKLGDLVCCVSGEEQDPDCREQVEKWRKQIACSSAAHPGNFVDILNLLSSLQED